MVCVGGGVEGGLFGGVCGGRGVEGGLFGGVCVWEGGGGRAAWWLRHFSPNFTYILDDLCLCVCGGGGGVGVQYQAT